MKITMYELLGLVKDGKAPKKIKINNKILNLENGKELEYRFEKGGTLCWDYYIELKKLNDEIEIIEEEKKTPEKLNYIHPDISCSYNESELLLRIEANKDKINEIIDYINKGDE